MATSPPGGPRLEPWAGLRQRTIRRREATKDVCEPVTGTRLRVRPSNVVTSLGVPDDLIGEIGQRILPLPDQILSA
jgi:hypothetical protein